eukprot:2092200-Rhodomonas_salina.4
MIGRAPPSRSSGVFRAQMSGGPWGAIRYLSTGQRVEIVVAYATSVPDKGSAVVGYATSVTGTSSAMPVRNSV